MRADAGPDDHLVVADVVEGRGNNPQQAWSWSTDAGATWNAFDVSDCGPGGGPFAGVAVPTASTIVSTVFGDVEVDQADWAGDPGIAASPDGSTVAMTNLAHAKTNQPSVWGNPLNGVVISTSIDGGHTFIRTVFANMTSSPDHECAAGDSVDQPSLTADPTVANRYYVAWRQNPTGRPRSRRLQRDCGDPDG